MSPQRVGNSSSGRLDQTEALRTERVARGADDLVIGHCVYDLVRSGCGGQIYFKIKIDPESLPDLGLVRHHAVICMQRQSANEDTITHRAPSIAAATRSACTVSFTSWARTIAAPYSTASK